MDEKQEMTAKILENVGKVIIGKKEVSKFILTAMLVNGHVLLEDVPGTGKTVMAKTFAKSIEAGFNRIQFTPDLLPSDVTGINYYNQKQEEFIFREGPVFTNILLADEINRATPRTQSALLECMEEHQVTIDGVTKRLDEPFIVIATQNPVETAGTYPLPEAQLDRFIMKINMGYPDKNEELDIINRFLKNSPLDMITPVCSKGDIVAMQEAVKDVYVHPAVMSYIVDIVNATRNNSSVSTGVSPRGTITMVNAARAFAYISGRGFVTPEDVKTLSVPIFSHRLVLKNGFAGIDGAEKIIEGIISSVEVPTEEWDR